jgi:hypothetical protein
MHGKHMNLIPLFWFELLEEVVGHVIRYPGIGKAKGEIKSLCHPKATVRIANVRKAYVCNPFNDSVIHLWSSEQGSSREEANLQLPSGASLKILNEFLADFGLLGRDRKVIAEL